MNTNKIAILAALGAAALMANASDAGASNPGGTKTTLIQLDGYCDVYTITVFPWHQAGTNDDSCDGIDALGSGMEGKVTGVSPKDLTIGEIYFGDFSSTYLVNIQYPLITGGTWSFYGSQDGAHYTFVNGGTYTIVGAGAARSPHMGPPAHRQVRN